MDESGVAPTGHDQFPKQPCPGSLGTISLSLPAHPCVRYTVVVFPKTGEKPLRTSMLRTASMLGVSLAPNTSNEKKIKDGITLRYGNASRTIPTNAQSDYLPLGKG